MQKGKLTCCCSGIATGGGYCARTAEAFKSTQARTAKMLGNRKQNMTLYPMA
jgi:hypothetical protein